MTNTPSIPDDLLPNLGVVGRQPPNTNPLNNTAYQFSVLRLPNVNWTCQSANLPGLVLGNAEQMTPFTRIPREGNATFEDLTIQFVVSEDMKNWYEVYNWIRQCTNIDNFDQYDREKIFSDATLQILSNKFNANVQVNFRDLFPVALSGIDFDSITDNSDPVTATVNFAYTSYNVVLKDCGNT